MASERVERVRAKSLALSAKVRRSAFLMLLRERSLVDGLMKEKEGFVLSNGLIDNLTPVPFSSE